MNAAMNTRFRSDPLLPELHTPRATRPSRPAETSHRRRVRHARRAAARLLMQAAERLSPLLAERMITYLARRPSPVFRSTQPQLPGATATCLPTAHGAVRIYRWGKSGPLALCVHGWGGCAAQMAVLVEPLLAAGYQVVAFDAPAHGASEGKRTDPIEFKRAIDAVSKAIGPVSAVIGHSFGAATALLAIRDLGLMPERVVLVSGYAGFEVVLHQLRSIFAVSSSVLERAFQRLFTRYSDRFDADELSPVSALRSLRCPTLILHDEDDAVVPVEHAERLLAASHAGTLVRTSGLGHHAIVNRLIGSWCADFITNPEAFAQSRKQVQAREG